MNRHSLRLLLLVILVRFCVNAHADEWIGGGVGPAPSCAENGLPAWQKERIASLLKERRKARYGISARALTVRDSIRNSYPFFPHAGIWGHDIRISGYVDLDPSPRLYTFDCNEFTYNGHSGVDSAIGTFAVQDIGVPVFAIQDGFVMETDDGHYDRNDIWNNQPSNFVVLEHDNGLITAYFHLKKGSVAVTAGDSVQAGQQIGLIGSSGISTGPHLHFETVYQGESLDPFSGPCQQEASLWMDQPSTSLPMQLTDVTLTTADLKEWKGPPYPTTNTGSILKGTRTLSVLVQIQSQPENVLYRLRFFRPNGTIRADSGDKVMVSPAYSSSWMWIGWELNFDTAGVWHVELSLEHKTMVKAPFLVALNRSQMNNRPPLPVEVKLTPAEASESDSIACRVKNFTILDDPDYDIVRYSYHWKANGITIRDVTSAALSDRIPRGAVHGGDQLVCEVTPSDGRVSASTTRAEMTVGTVSAVENPRLHIPAIEKK